MIDIRYERQLKAHNLSIMGHAQYAEYGHDIVCAGISALVYALVGYIEACDDEELTNLTMQEGLVDMVCGAGNRDIDTAFDMACIGFNQIAATYPQYVSFTNTP